MLHGQIPLHHPRSVKGRWHAGDLKLRVRIAQRVKRIAVRELLRDLRPDKIEGRIVPWAGEAPRTDFLKSVVDAISSAQYSLWTEGVSEANPRREIIFVRGNEIARSIAV